jgi:hypothetical protein
MRRHTLSLCLPVKRVPFNYFVLDLFVFELVELLNLLFVDIFCALLVYGNCRLGGLWLALL